MINNTGFLVARDGVTAVDACSTERRTRAFLDTVAGVARLPVRTLVNTHHHHDHTAGNGLFAGATIVRSVDLGEYAQWSDQERIVGNLYRAYADLSGSEQRGGPVNGLNALSDMIAYNGGRPLTCRA